MKNILRFLLAAATISLALVPFSRAADTAPGFFDAGQFTSAQNGKFVEVNLSPALLKFAAKIAAFKEPEAAALLGNLSHVRVNVVGLDDKNRADTVERITAIRRQLTKQGWTQMVTVREKADGANVDVHMKLNANDAIDGLVVTVIGDNNEAVFVNIVGNITAEQLGEIAERFDIDPLRKVHAKLEHKRA